MSQSTVRAVYEDGVFKPRERVDLEEHTEVQLEVREEPAAGTEDDDILSFVGCIEDAPDGMPIARDHDEYLDDPDE